MKLNFDSIYRRTDNILYQDEVPIYRFDHNFPDFEVLSEQGVKYMEDYINAWPNLCEVLPGWIVSDNSQTEPIDVEKCKQSVEYFVDKVVLPQNKLQQANEKSHNPNGSRKDQVRFWMSKGTTSPSIIATCLGTNASYVQRLIKEIKNENNLVQRFNKDLELCIVTDQEGQIDIHFGEVLNDQVKDYHQEIEKALKFYCKSGCATIVTTQGKKTSLLSVLYYAEAINYQNELKIEYI